MKAAPQKPLFETLRQGGGASDQPLQVGRCEINSRVGRRGSLARNLNDAGPSTGADMSFWITCTWWGWDLSPSAAGAGLWPDSSTASKTLVCLTCAKLLMISARRVLAVRTATEWRYSAGCCRHCAA
jgi:hypothetical protein